MINVLKVGFLTFLLGTGVAYASPANIPEQCLYIEENGLKCVVLSACGQIVMADCESECGGGCKRSFLDQNANILSECISGGYPAEMAQNDPIIKKMTPPECIPQGWTCDVEFYPQNGPRNCKSQRYPGPKYAY